MRFITILALLGLLIAPRLTAPPAQPTVAALQGVAARLGSTVVAYSVSDEATMVRIVGRGGLVDTQSIPVSRSRLERLVRLTRPGAPATGDASVPAPEPVPDALRFVTMRGGGALGSTGQEAGAYRVLYELLVGPVRADLPGRDSVLTIMADGPLAELSYAPLGNENGRLLIEDYRLHYLAGASLERPAAPASADRRDTFLFVASPAAATREVRAIVRILGLANPTILSGQGVTARALRGAIGKARVAHFAGARALDTLTEAEIAALQLSTDLVVIGVSRDTLPPAFLSAGVRTLLAPMWDIGEESWEPVMTRFYQEWQKSGDKSGALRAAQLSVLRDLRAGRLKVNTPSGDMALPPHPLLWANAILMGEP